ncbi:MAG: hypothetical protein ABTQ26_00300 [Azonexus sp.]
MEIGAAISSLSAAFGIAKSAMEARDEVKAQAAIADFNAKHIALSMAALDLVEKLNTLLRTNHDLETKIAEHQRKTGERDNYSLHELAPGRFAYRFKPADVSGDPVHYVCQLCYDKGIKSVLRLQEASEYTSRYLSCLEASAHDLYF